MVTIRITGGIGNQLFQYALGLALQQQFKKQVRFDVSYFNLPGRDDTTTRELTLTALDLGEFEITESEALIPVDMVSKVSRLAGRLLLPYYKNSYVFERQLTFDPNIFKIGNNTYLDGYWQSPKYFEGIESLLRSKIQIKNKLSSGATEISNLIKGCQNAVSLHIRRGDYLSKYSHVYYTQPVEYYIRALTYVANKAGTDNLNLFVFSDDITWCRDHLDFQYATTFMDRANSNVYEDMALMAECDHHIISNSTYSWWGAWLNAKENKTVICPQNWFKDPIQNSLFVNSIYPSSWICL